MLSQPIAEGASVMVSTLRDRGMIRDITFADVLGELSQRALSEEEMVECLKWRIALNTSEVKSHDIELRRQFLEAAVFTADSSIEGGMKPEHAGSRVIPLSSIRTYLSPGNVIPPNVPLPPHTLPFSVSKHFKPDSLHTFFGWSDLSIPSWIEYLVTVSSGGRSVFEADNDLTLSAPFAERTLAIIAKGWNNNSKVHQERVVELLKDRPIIPTRSGMKVPKEAYFANANVFPDLAIIELPKGTAIKGPMEKVCLFSCDQGNRLMPLTL